MSDDVLVFRLDDRLYGLRIAHVHEVLRAVAMSAPPNVDAPIEGVINLRGAPVAVLNLRLRFQLPSRALSPSDYLIVIQQDQRLFAVRTERPVEIQPIESGRFAPVDRATCPLEAVVELAQLDERVVFVLEPRRLLADFEVATSGKIGTPSAGEGES